MSSIKINWYWGDLPNMILLERWGFGILLCNVFLEVHLYEGHLAFGFGKFFCGWRYESKWMQIMHTYEERREQ